MMSGRHVVMSSIILLFMFGICLALLVRAERYEVLYADALDKLDTLSAVEQQLKRDDHIFELLMGDWNRDMAVKSMPVTLTAYTSRPEETDDTPYITACNTPVVVGGVAVSRDLFSLLGGCGASVIIPGRGLVTVNDKMNSRYTASIDMWSGDLGAARLHGRQKATMVWQ